MKNLPVRIGYIGGQPQRINERAIDSQWIGYLGEHAETVSIPPLSIMKLFGGAIEQWRRKLPGSIEGFAERLRQLCAKYEIQAMYVNLPVLLPYLMMARNEGGIKLSFLFIAHSVGSEFWLKQWIGIAPLLQQQDVLLTSSASSREALLRLSPVYRHAKLIPLCIQTREGASIRSTAMRDHSSARNMLAIGRIDPDKNIHVLLRCFAEIRRQVPDAHLYIAGEYTGASAEAIDRYRSELAAFIENACLSDCVSFTGPVIGEQKEQLFAQADVLVNLSTDLGETFGFNLLEAKTWGLPVVCTGWDGFCELVADGEDGILTACHWDGDSPTVDEADVVQACVRLLSDDVLRERLAANAWHRARNYDYHMIMPQIIAELEAALEVPAARREIPFNTPIAELDELYELSALDRLPFLNETPVSILSLADTHAPEWPSMVKPVVQHFARRTSYAEL